MTYEELKKIAQPHIREGENLPSNSLLLLTQLHIPYKTEVQCREDFEGKYNPLDNHPAFLFIDENKNKTVYFKTATKYWNFYIFHEVAHYLLGHEDDCPQNEIDADMLACILTAPIENLPTYLKTAQDLSSLCKIPIDKAEMYWQEIKDAVTPPKTSKKHFSTIIITLLVIMLIAIGFIVFSNAGEQKPSYSPPEVTSTPSSPNVNSHSDLTYVTVHGKKYHKADCQYIKYKTNITELSIEDAESLQLEPCSICFENQ